jgi:hypothetical protein
LINLKILYLHSLEREFINIFINQKVK